MRVLYFVALTLGYLVCSNAKKSNEYEALIVDEHNELRRKQHGANENKLTWDDKLAQKADIWVKKCNFDHERKGFGENLAFNTVDDVNAVIVEAMDTWYDEIKMYSLAAKACMSSCHYTQMVWHDTQLIGCAHHKCPSLTTGWGSPVQNAWYFACWYSPQGNDMSDTPYEPGAPCSKCAPGQGCENGLCVGEVKIECKDKQTSCERWSKDGECTKNEPYMSKECPKSCKICEGGDEDGGAGQGPCIDKDKNCKAWDFSCTSNKDFMLDNCPKTCGFC